MLHRIRIHRDFASAVTAGLLASCGCCGCGHSSPPVIPIAPAVTWSTPAAITNGTPLSATQLDATANVPGTFVYSPASGTMLAAGTQMLSVIFTPADTTDYTTGSASVQLVVNKVVPTITWATPAAIPYGTPLSAAQLDAFSAVEGTFIYSPASGAVLTAGTQTLSVIFTPADTTNNTEASASVQIIVDKAVPTINWATSATIPYKRALSAVELDATSAVSGTFTYSPPAGTILPAGTQTLSVILTPADTTDYTTATATVQLIVNPAIPTITWATPAAISQGTALSVAQLNASSTVAGTFVYSPPAGTVLATGTQMLSVTFTPSDRSDYTTANASVKLTVVATGPEVYNWLPVRIIDGGTMTGLYMHPAQQGLMYTRANVGGAYLRNTAHPTWLPLTDWLNGLSPDWSLMGIESVALDPTDVNRLYLSAGSYIGTGYPNGAILVSSDQGATFKTVNLPFQLGANDLVHGQQGGERLAVDPFSPAQLFLGTHQNGLWVSNDHGATWNQSATFPVTSTPDLVGVVFIRFDPSHSGTVYVGVYTGGIYSSPDGGITWRQIPGQPTLLPDGETIRPMRSALGPDGMLYVTYSNNAGLATISNGAVWKFSTGSGVWSDITPPESMGSLWYGYCAVSADAGHAGTVMAGTWNRWYPGDDIFRSTDGGATWNSLVSYSVRDASLALYENDLGTSTFGGYNTSIEIDPFNSNHALYEGGSMIWETSNLTAMDTFATTQWTVGALGVEETVIHDVVSPPSVTHLFSAMADLGGFRHDNFLLSPAPFLNPLMIEVASLDFAELNPLFVARVGGLDYKGNVAAAFSRDGSVTWTQYPGMPPGAGPGPDIDGYAAMVAVSADGATVIWAPGDSVPAYFGSAGAWISSQGAPVGVRVVSDRVNPKKFYGYDPGSGTLFVSSDGGKTFVAGATGLPKDPGIPGWSSQAHPKAVFGIEGDLWLPLAAGLYHSADSGTSFIRISSITSAPLVGFGLNVVGAAYPAIYAVGTVSGVYGIFRSIDEGISWTRINDDAHQFGQLAAISGDPQIYGRVYIGTSGRGIVYGDISSPN